MDGSAVRGQGRLQGVKLYLRDLLVASNPIAFWDGKLFGILGSEGPEQDGGAVGGKGSFQEVNCNFGFEQAIDLFLV